LFLEGRRAPGDVRVHAPRLAARKRRASEAHVVVLVVGVDPLGGGRREVGERGDGFGLLRVRWVATMFAVGCEGALRGE
jgi:hypothetical protein